MKRLCTERKTLHVLLVMTWNVSFEIKNKENIITSFRKKSHSDVTRAFSEVLSAPGNFSLSGRLLFLILWTQATTFKLRLQFYDHFGPDWSISKNNGWIFMIPRGWILQTLMIHYSYHATEVEMRICFVFLTKTSRLQPRQTHLNLTSLLAFKVQCVIWSGIKQNRLGRNIMY